MYFAAYYSPVRKVLWYLRKREIGEIQVHISWVMSMTRPYVGKS